jgi:hypothetical protein
VAQREVADLVADDEVDAAVVFGTGLEKVGVEHHEAAIEEPHRERVERAPMVV